MSLTRRQLANAIRALSMDAVQKANSGHPGMPMGMADIGEVLWNDFFKHNPENPEWPNRDRFILSNGHGCLLQYTMLHLSGYALTIEDLKAFRQLHSKTPGHPEYGHTPGVETTTGPLGQGLGNAVGMALAESLLAEEFNRPGFDIIDNYIYCVVGDGCLMEGISHEVSALAGTLGLGKLIVFWDDNGISIDGKVANWFRDDTPKRFEAYGWHVIKEVNGQDADAVKRAIIEARNIKHQPSLICCQTLIGFGAPTVAGTEKCHGSPLGAIEVEGARKALDWEYPPFVIPPEYYQAWDAREKGREEEKKWRKHFEDYRAAYPALASELERRLNRILPSNFNETMDAFIAKTAKNSENIATRKASQHTLEVLVPLLPELLGGSADLSESNSTFTKFSKTILPKHIVGNYLHYGVREFGMSAMMTGIALYRGFIPYGGTFLVFLDYARNAVRLAALMKQRVIFVYSHDSVGLGEDGPTHQPIEHLTMLRITPNMSLWRPCDATETAVAWKMAIQRMQGPSSIALTRQAVPHQIRTEAQIACIEKGGYILINAGDDAEGIIIATGSEVGLAVEAAKRLLAEGRRLTVVSMPSVDHFLAQPLAYRESVLPTHLRKRIAIEAGATAYWTQWVGSEGAVVGIDRFGESAPGQKVFEALGLTVEALQKTVLEVLNRK